MLRTASQDLWAALGYPEPEPEPEPEPGRCVVGGPAELLVRPLIGLGDGQLTVRVERLQSVAQLTAAIAERLGLRADGTAVVVEYQEPDFGGEFLLLERVQDLPAQGAQLRVRRAVTIVPELVLPGERPARAGPAEGAERIPALRAALPADLLARAGPRRGTDGYLMRFLRARDFDVEAAAEMLTACLKFRQQQGLSAARDGGDAAALSAEDLALEASLRPLLLYDITQRDKNGRPVMMELVGRWDCDKISQFIEADGGLEKVIRGHLVRVQATSCLLARVYSSV